MSRILVATKLLPATVDRLDALADRMGWSRAATVEVLVNTYSDGINKDTPIPAGAIPAGARVPGQKRGQRRAKKTKK